MVLKKLSPMLLGCLVASVSVGPVYSKGFAALAFSSAEPDADLAAQTAALREKIAAEIGDRANTAPAEDLEAAVVLVVSQGNYSQAAVDQATSQMEVGASPALVKALKAARTALSKKDDGKAVAARQAGRGTGAPIGNAGSDAGGFSAPTSVGAGGQSGYTGG